MLCKFRFKNSLNAYFHSAVPVYGANSHKPLQEHFPLSTPFKYSQYSLKHSRHLLELRKMLDSPLSTD